ncbi:hypothetical protein HDU84_004732 [Entophlyctis sp. JEL0112]|nr:hypothetical protein HDU84_004732 [Entophlyctis sp. JEL0112]
MDAQTVNFTVSYQRTSHSYTLPLSTTVGALKEAIAERTGVHQNLQKLLFKGVLKDNDTLANARITDGTKVLLMASKEQDILHVVEAPSRASLESSGADLTAGAEKPKMFADEAHAKVLRRGKPDYAMDPSAATISESPRTPLPALGVVGANQRGMKTRLSFRADTQELQIATAERTQKVAFTGISRILAEDMPLVDAKGERIEEGGASGYAAVGIQIGTTDKSVLWFYWIPSHFVESMKDAVFGAFPSARFLLDRIMNA